MFVGVLCVCVFSRKKRWSHLGHDPKNHPKVFGKEMSLFLQKLLKKLSSFHRIFLCIVSRPKMAAVILPVFAGFGRHMELTARKMRRRELPEEAPGWLWCRLTFENHRIKPVWVICSATCSQNILNVTYRLVSVYQSLYLIKKRLLESMLKLTNDKLKWKIKKEKSWYIW